jgi:uncharacterized membrane protein
MCGPSSRISDDSSWTGGAESVRDILDKRYARGEIGKTEYEQKEKEIERRHNS